MKAAQDLLQHLSALGVRACFANPGTSEMHLVAALDSAPTIRPILCLFEGVATGAADGFGRMSGSPALTLLHLGPGLGNGLANLHNAWRARTPLISLIGEHATYHRSNDPPLASDIAALARPVSAWLRTVESADALTSLGAEAFAAACREGPAALILPADIAWSDTQPAKPNISTQARSEAWTVRLDAAAAALRTKPSVLLIGGRNLSARACEAAGRIADATGARVFVETFPARIARGAGRRSFARLPYLTEMAVGLLADAATIIGVGAGPPVAFFALPERATRLAPDTAQFLQLSEKIDDSEAVLEALAEVLGAKQHAERPAAERPALQTTDAPLDSLRLAQALAATLPEDAIVSDESITLGAGAFDMAAGAAHHDWLTLTGGAIGQGLPLATGAAVACPERRVVALQADGSALYTIQALWTQAREQLNVTNVILNNGAYAILSLELMRTGVTNDSHAARELFNLNRPVIDFCSVARGFGMPAVQVHSAKALEAALHRSFATPGPMLIEAIFPQ
ncbi:MAG: acetolactate synthase large subunit [Proteobacteria bacterium]|nr:acetolactate synthase large subunit [Pseudomonadota bacterium]